jgi:phospholipase C
VTALEAHGRTWKVYVAEPMRVSFTGWIHMPQLKDRLAAHFVPFSEFERDAANGTLPDFSMIEPSLIAGHGDYHPACGRSFIGEDVNIAVDPPSAIRSGENFLARIYKAIKSADSAEGSNAYNTTFLIGWDEPGGTYDHVAPGPAAPPDPSAPRGQCDFTFDRSGYRVPAIIVSPWVDEGIVINEEYRHTSPRCARPGTSATRSPTATQPPALSSTCFPAEPRATPPPGPTCTHSPCRTGSSPRSSLARRSAPSARPSPPACSRTHSSPGTRSPPS